MALPNKRFSGLEWASAKEDILILGAGGVSSWLSLFLGRIGHNLTIYDFDTYEFSNLSGQFVSNNEIGLNKAIAVKELVKAFGCYETIIHPMNRRFDESSSIFNIVFSGIDSMEGRKLAFEKWVKKQADKPVRDPNEINIFIDFRMSAEKGELYCITRSSQVEKYRATLFTDGEANDLPCNLKATTHTGAMLASLGVACFNNHVVNKHYGMVIRDVPFYVSFDFPLMLINSEI